MALVAQSFWNPDEVTCHGMTKSYNTKRLVGSSDKPFLILFHYDYCN